MTARRGIKVVMGLTSVRGPQWASEPGYVSQMNSVIRGIEDQLIGIMKMFEEDAPDVMVDALKPNLEQAKLYCPVRTGALADSGYLEVKQFRGNPRVEIGFAKGGNPRYGVYVHEMPVPHKNGTYKFLERAIMEDLPGIEARIGARYAARLVNGR